MCVPWLCVYSAACTGRALSTGLYHVRPCRSNVAYGASIVLYNAWLKLLAEAHWDVLAVKGTSEYVIKCAHMLANTFTFMHVCLTRMSHTLVRVRVRVRVCVCVCVCVCVYILYEITRLPCPQQNILGAHIHTGTQTQTTTL